MGVHPSSPISPLPTYRKALYMGRYQQTKEQGVKRRAQRMDSPKPEPLLVSTQKLARQARKFRSRARVLPEGQGQDDGSFWVRWKLLPCKPTHSPHQTWQSKGRGTASAFTEPSTQQGGRTSKSQSCVISFAKIFKGFRIHLCVRTRQKGRGLTYVC